ncbi:MAG: hypothetical protein ABSG17_12545 [Spirochaetia bacterium]|jgi:hypothetical protein
MLQFYLLSVFANLMASLTLAGDYLGEKLPFLGCFKEVRTKRSARMTIGIAALVVGIIKLFVLAPGEHVIIVGDFLPAAAGIIIGAILLAEINPAKVEQAGEPIRKISRTALTYRVPVSIAGIVVALLHFLFPEMAVL